MRAPSQTLQIIFEGRSVPAGPSDSIASALVAAGELACREAAPGDRRGVFCGMGVCQECLVRVDGADGIRACATPVRDGMAVERQGRPALTPHPWPQRGPAREAEADVVVVGGGPAGMAAAAAAAEAGASVVLVDERAKLGGQYYKQPDDRLVADPGRLDRQYRGGRALAERVRRSGARVLSGVSVWGAIDAHDLLARDDAGDWRIRGRRLVLAPGAYERAVPFPGWTLPGVMTTGAAQTLLRAHQVAAGTRVLVSGNGPLNLQLAAELAAHGIDVAAVAELAPMRRPSRLPHAAAMAAAAPDLAVDGLRYGWALRRVPLHLGWAVVRAEGDGRVERAVVARIGGDGRPVAGTERAYDVDAVCVGFGFVPSTELARSLGCRHTWDAQGGHLRADVDELGRSSVDGVHVVGDGAGIGGARLAQAVGTLAGLDAARAAGHPGGPETERLRRDARRARRRHARFQRALWRLYAAPRLVDELAAPDTLICRCERVAHRDVAEAFDGGIGHIGAVKRATRAGMGPCQGRYCAPVLAEMGARAAGRPLTEDDLFAPAAPFKPLPIDAVIETAATEETAR